MKRRFKYKFAQPLQYILYCSLSLVYGCSTGTMDKGLILIAHRGGVVDAQRSENSISALEEAIRRGYTHVEIDARPTADGHVVCFHNDDLFEEAGIHGLISELPKDSVQKIVLPKSGFCRQILHF